MVVVRRGMMVSIILWAFISVLLSMLAETLRCMSSSL